MHVQPWAALCPGSSGGKQGWQIPHHPSPLAHGLCARKRPPHIVLTLWEGNPTSSTSHCCPVQTGNKGEPGGQRSWQTLVTVPLALCPVTPCHAIGGGEKSENVSARRSFVSSGKTKIYTATREVSYSIPLSWYSRFGNEAKTRDQLKQLPS